MARYKSAARKDMDSLWSGCGTFRWSTLLGVMLVPISGLLANMLPVALSLSMLIQGYICVMLCMEFCRTDKDKGICGIMGAILAAKGATFGLIVGVVFYYCLKGPQERRAEQKEKRAAFEAEEEEKRAKLMPNSL
jgi:hypothetical protein